MATTSGGVWSYRITNALYFAPQYVFPFGYRWRPLPEPSPDAHPLGHWVSVLVWAEVVVGFGRFGRRLGWRGLALAAPFVVAAMAGAQQVAVRYGALVSTACKLMVRTRMVEAGSTGPVKVPRR